MRRASFVTLLGSAALFVATGRLGAQSQLRSPLGGSQSASRSGPRDRVEKRAWDAADLMPGFSWATARVSLAGTDFVFVRGWTAGGTGAGQVSYLIYVPKSSDSVRLVWSAPDWEYSSPPRRVWVSEGRWERIKDRPYSLRGCLYVTTAGELAYATRRAPPKRAFDEPPLPRAGYYRWKPEAGTFSHVRPADDALRARCGREQAEEEK